MSRTWTRIRALIAAAALLAAAFQPAPGAAVPLADEVSADRVALERAVERLEAAQAAADKVDERVRAESAELDRLVAEEAACQQRLRTRVVAMYRSDTAGTLSLLLGASSIPDLMTRLELLDRIARQDAQNLEALDAARLQIARSAEELLAVQAEQAQELDALAEEVARAKQELAGSQAALREYEERRAAAARAAAARKSAEQQLTGSGEWQTAVASHYSRTFTGRGASGEKIGPYSMIVAHKTLPFGTLVEFEYKGKRAVAKVADRGPYVSGRTWDLGPGVVRVLDFNGVHTVRYRIISK